MIADPNQPPPDIVPALRYEKGQAALDFLEGAFGFNEVMAVKDDEGRLVHAELKFGGGVVYLGEVNVAEGHEAVDAARFGIAVYVEDVDGHYAREGGRRRDPPPADGHGLRRPLLRGAGL